MLKWILGLPYAVWAMRWKWRFQYRLKKRMERMERLTGKLARPNDILKSCLEMARIWELEDKLVEIEDIERDLACEADEQTGRVVLSIPRYYYLDDYTSNYMVILPNEGRLKCLNGF